MPTLTLYGKPGCHLCEEARAAVEAATTDRAVEVRQVDVSLDPALNRLYGERIPVVELDGEELFELFVDPASLRERLARVAPS